MQLVFLPLGVTLLIDCLAWALFHVIAGYVAWRTPDARLSADKGLFRFRKWEKQEGFYRKVLRIHRWKGFFPEAGGFFPGGFSKKRMLNRQPGYMERFVRETRRGELSHWLSMLPAPLFFLWNDWRIGIGMLVYALVVNLPFIAINRFNRRRFKETLRMAGNRQGPASRRAAQAL